jgi:xylulose-5-phosphate/fructose-6-phosphate phosphoketolase
MSHNATFEFDASVSSAVSAPWGQLHRYWQAANYLTVGQIYLKDNPLLREPLRPEHIKPRLLGHWGTSPGLSFIYAHLNRLITAHDVNAIYLAGPGHGGPAIVANVYLEGTYSEIYPTITRDTEGLRRFFRQFSTPGGIPSHVSVTTPGSIHEGGELGYVLAHAYGAAFDNPGLLVVAVVGDGEAETGPLAGSWKGTRFSNLDRDGSVLPILHLNGYKISGPTIFGRAKDTDLRNILEAEGHEVHMVEGDDPMHLHGEFASTLDACYANLHHRPAIILRTPKGWTGPKELDGLPVEGTFRAHQVPLPDVRTNAEQLRMFEDWMRSYQPETLFDESGALMPDLAALAPKGDRRMGANPHANGGRLTQPLDLPDFRKYAIDVPAPATIKRESTRQLGAQCRDIFVRNPKNFRLTCPDETNSNRLGDVFQVENRCFVGPILAIDDHVSPTGRVMEVLSEHLCEGWLEGYVLTGRHGLFATYEAFAMVSASMTVQHTKWLEAACDLPWRAPVPSLNILLTSTAWRNDHNGFSHQGPGLIDVMLSKRGTVSRIYLPPDANCLLSTADHCFRSKSYVNLIVIDKQPQLQWLPMDAAIEHCERGASIWEWASTDAGVDPDVVLGCAGDIPTLETIAAAWWLRKLAPELRVRVVNVVDLMTLFSPSEHPHGMPDDAFVQLFGADTPVVFAWHGYQRGIHAIIHGRPHASRFHVRGFNEQGTTTTPFDMVVLNGMSRYHLAAEAIRRTTRLGNNGSELIARFIQMTKDATRYSYEHMEDEPDIANWTWT